VDRLLHEVSSSVARRQQIGGDPVAVKLDDSTWERLRALGYVGDTAPGSEAGREGER
jgi:hypothetical protein